MMELQNRSNYANDIHVSGYVYIIVKPYANRQDDPTRL